MKVAETSAEIVEGKETSDSARGVVVSWTSETVDEGICTPMSETSIDEVGRLGRSRAEVALSKFVPLLSDSSEILDVIASVVIGEGTTSLQVTLLRVVASASTLVVSIERL